MTFSRLRRKLLPPPDAPLECQSAGTKGLFRGGSLSANKQKELEALNAMLLQWDAFLWLEDAISEVRCVLCWLLWRMHRFCMQCGSRTASRSGHLNCILCLDKTASAISRM